MWRGNNIHRGARTDDNMNIYLLLLTSCGRNPAGSAHDDSLLPRSLRSFASKLGPCYSANNLLRSDLQPLFCHIDANSSPSALLLLGC